MENTPKIDDKTNLTQLLDDKYLDELHDLAHSFEEPATNLNMNQEEKVRLIRLSVHHPKYFPILLKLYQRCVELSKAQKGIPQYRLNRRFLVDHYNTLHYVKMFLQNLEQVGLVKQEIAWTRNKVLGFTVNVPAFIKVFTPLLIEKRKKMIADKNTKKQQNI